MRLGEFIRCHRERCLMSQGELARKVGVSTSRISQIERGDGSLSGQTMVSLCTVLEVSLEYVIEKAAEQVATGRKREEP